ncbi:MAG: hypothetical protein AAB866_00520, partial [Patescibacteria group bacterium]
MKTKHKKVKIIGVIAVRTSSTRLPQKALLKIGNYNLIERIIERAKTIRGLAGVVMCTSEKPEDDILEKIAKKQGVLCFRGSLEDKLARFLGAAVKFKADYLIMLDGDDPFCDPELVELAVK